MSDEIVEAPPAAPLTLSLTHVQALIDGLATVLEIKYRRIKTAHGDLFDQLFAQITAAETTRRELQIRKHVATSTEELVRLTHECAAIDRAREFWASLISDTRESTNHVFAALVARAHRQHRILSDRMIDLEVECTIEIPVELTNVLRGEELL